MEYYVQVSSGDTYGPASEEAIKAWLEEGRIARGDQLIAAAGGWRGTVNDLIPAIPAPPPVSPLAPPAIVAPVVPPVSEVAPAPPVSPEPMSPPVVPPQVAAPSVSAPAPTAPPEGPAPAAPTAKKKVPEWVGVVGALGVVGIGFAIYWFGFRKGAEPAPPAVTVASSPSPTPSGTPVDSNEERLAKEEISNLKQLNVGIQMYLADNDDTMPLLNWDSAVMPYVKNSTYLYSVHPNGGKVAFTEGFVGMSVTAIEQPANTILLTDPNTWFGTQKIVSRVDSSTKLSTPDEYASMMSITDAAVKLNAPNYERIRRGDAAPPTPTPTTTPTPSPSPTPSPTETPNPSPPAMGDAKGGGTASNGMISIDVEGQPILYPSGWSRSDDLNSEGGALTTFKSPDGKASFVVERVVGEKDPVSMMKSEEARLKKLAVRKYEAVFFRTGAEAYRNGIIWNFKVTIDGVRRKRTVVYFNHNGTFWALSSSVVESSGTNPPFTEMFDVVKTW
jgi:outer membrane biosynthesis protein TonB